MASCIIFCLVVVALNPISSQGQELSKLRRFLFEDFMTRLSRYKIPMDPEDLPLAEPMHPGHTLLRPDRHTLKSAAKFPQSGKSGHFVYGNINNLGITYGKTPNRVLYTSFRKHNMLLDSILEAVSKSNNNGNVKNSPLVILGPFSLKRKRVTPRKHKLTPLGDMAGEILDDQYNEDDELNVRRAPLSHQNSSLNHQNSSQHALHGGNCTRSSSEESKSASSSSEHEKNPGNPYTVLREKYQQNYPWNYEMDGNHMNINQYGPEFNTMGPNAGDLFYGRKWWYFNQDDYIPLG